MLLVIALAGCTAPETDEGPDLIGICPQWVQGDDVQTHSGAAGELDLTFVNETDAGPLDMVLFTIETDAPMVLKAHDADGARILLRNGEDGVPSMTIDGEREVRVYLSAVTHGSEPAPGPVRLSFEGDGSYSLEARPFYRVCGVPGPSST